MKPVPSESGAPSAEVTAEEPATLLSAVLENGIAAAEAPRPRLTGVVIGTLAGLDVSGCPLVDYPANADGLLPARSTVPLGQGDVGREVALMFEDGDPARPLLLGLIQHPTPSLPAGAAAAKPRPVAVEADRERLVFTADKEIVLRCGQASITLTRAGKVLLRGTYLLSRSSGVNRVKGGSVQIN
jgi:hypothetical protein